MTVNKLNELAKSIKNKWQTNIVAPRANELSTLKQHFGSETTFEDVTQRVDGWIADLTKLESKPRVSLSVSKLLLESSTLCLSGLSNALDQHQNGLDWLCSQRNFQTNFLLATLLIKELTSELGKESVAMQVAARTLLESDLNHIQKSSDFAQKLIQNQGNINAHIEKISSASETVSTRTTELTNQIDTAQQNVLTSITAFDITKETAIAALSDSIALKTNAQTLLDTVTKVRDESQFGLDEALLNLNKAKDQQTLANQRLAKALQSAQMEGLAGSFTNKVDDISEEIKQVQKRFDISLIYLALIAMLSLIVEIYTGLTTNLDTISLKFLRMLPLAAPGIWIAWSAARNLAALKRIFSDYQYKSASALAYESYRQTVSEAGDNELKNQLLSFAIKAFGENPTKYYDSAQNESASPAESMFSSVNPFKKSETNAKSN